VKKLPRRKFCAARAGEMLSQTEGSHVEAGCVRDQNLEGEEGAELASPAWRSQRRPVLESLTETVVKEFQDCMFFVWRRYSSRMYSGHGDFQNCHH